ISLCGLSMFESPATNHGQTWQLRGVVSNPRYATAAELKQLAAVSPPLGRPEATFAALIPIRKSETWWSMGQDERRAIFEDSSKDISRSMKHLPAVARRLHHSRELRGGIRFSDVVRICSAVSSVLRSPRKRPARE